MPDTPAAKTKTSAPETPVVEEAKPIKYPEGKIEIQGHTKVTREAGDSNTGKAEPGDAVQQGGGGAIDSKTGTPIAPEKS